MNVFDKAKKALSLRHFLTAEAEEEIPADVVDTAPADEEEGEQEEEETAEEVGEASPGDDSPATETEEPSTVEASAGLTDVPGAEAVGVAELAQLRADAQAWSDNRAELATLQGWYQTQKRGAVLPKGDASDAGGTKRSWEAAPWNQA